MLKQARGRLARDADELVEADLLDLHSDMLGAGAPSRRRLLHGDVPLGD
jgi:hypothetical protein